MTGSIHQKVCLSKDINCVLFDYKGLREKPFDHEFKKKLQHSSLNCDISQKSTLGHLKIGSPRLRSRYLHLNFSFQKFPVFDIKYKLGP